MAAGRYGPRKRRRTRTRPVHRTDFTNLPPGTTIGQAMRMVGTRTEAACGEACQTASSHPLTCKCSCAGANHGIAPKPY